MVHQTTDVKEFRELFDCSSCFIHHRKESIISRISNTKSWPVFLDDVPGFFFVEFMEKADFAERF
jgi:hypothetical protein